MEEENNKTKLLDMFKKELELIKFSSFAPYKNPVSLYQHVINSLCVKNHSFRKDTQSGFKCPFEEQWKVWKDQDFPIDLIGDNIIAAAAQIKTSKPGSQRKISQFFTPVPSPVAAFILEPQIEILEEEVEPGVLEEPVHSPGESNANIPVYKNSNTVDTNLDFAVNLQSVYSALDQTHGEDVSRLYKSTEPMNVALRGLPDIFVKNKKLTEEVNSYASYFRENSELSKERDAAFADISDLKNYLVELFENSVDALKRVEGFTVPEAANILQFCAIKEKEIKSKIIRSCLNLSREIKKLNRKLEKRLSNMITTNNNKKSKKELNITCPNASKSWFECLEAVSEDVTMGLTSLSPDELEKISHFFHWLSVNKYEFVTPQDILEYLKRPIVALKTFTNLLVEHLPVVKLIFNNSIILMDSETFFCGPEKIYQLMHVAVECESSEVILDEPKKVPRQIGSGRIPLTKSRPEIVEATRRFAENSGTETDCFKYECKV